MGWFSENVGLILDENGIGFEQVVRGGLLISWRGHK